MPESAPPGWVSTKDAAFVDAEVHQVPAPVRFVE
jgi:hypothetical protein